MNHPTDEPSHGETTIDRRDFMHLSAYAAASALLPGCSNTPTDPVVPTAQVAAVRGTDLYAMTRDVMDGLGGIETVVHQGETVFIKPNMVTLPWAENSNRFAMGECTKPEIVVAVAEQCLEAGAAEVIIGDGSHAPVLNWEHAVTLDGSANLERGIPLCSIGISIIPFSNSMTSDDIEISIIESIFTDETYIAIQGQGVTKNGKRVKPTTQSLAKEAIISYDTKRSWKGEFGNKSRSTLEGLHDIRRTGSNLLDLCWTAAGSLDAMVDLRDILNIVHVSGTHMVSEAGGYVADSTGNRFCVPIEYDQRMSFIAASTKSLAFEILRLHNQPAH